MYQFFPTLSGVHKLIDLRLLCGLFKQTGCRSKAGCTQQHSSKADVLSGRDSHIVIDRAYPASVVNC